MKSIFKKLGELVVNNTKITVILVVLGIVFFLGVGVYISYQAKLEEDARQARMEEARQASESSSESADSLLIQVQPDLVDKFGSVPEGFIWDMDGTVLSLGDQSMSAEDVVFAYLQGLSSLDISTVQRYSRRSSVVERYGSYFDSTDKTTDYTDQFMRGMYRESLLSLQSKGIESNAVFAENKQVFTINLRLLDLTDKDFWRHDQMEIYENLYMYYSDESDSTKSDMYLYEYILDYYQSGDAQLRDITVDITVQRYPDLDSGWLVSVDTDVDSACIYKEGNLVVSYIKEQYRDYGRELVEDSRGVQ
jgi:hypothetical protein